MEFIFGFIAGVVVTSIVAFLVWRNNKKHAENLDSKFGILLNSAKTELDEKIGQVQGLINQLKK